MKRNRAPWDTIRIAGWGFTAGLSFSIAKLFLPGEEGRLLDESAADILAYFGEATIAGAVLFGAVSALRNDCSLVAPVELREETATDPYQVVEKIQMGGKDVVLACPGYASAAT